MKELPDLIREAQQRGCLDLALRIVACYAQRDAENGYASSQHETSRKAASLSTDAAAGYGCATRPAAEG